MWNRHRLAFLLSLGLIALGAANVYYIASRWPEIRPQLSHYKQRILEKDSGFTEAVNNIAAHVQSKAYASESEKLDYIRKWVNSNSTDPGKDSLYQSQPHVTVPLLWMRHAGIGDGPLVACGGRAYAMKAILDKLRIKSRIIDVVNLYAEPQYGTGHTFLEVWNKETGSWEIQDPHFNLSYRHVHSLERVSVFQMVMGNIDQVEPMDENSHGWYALRRAKLKAYFGVVVYRLSYDGHRSIAIIAPNNPMAKIGDLNSEIANHLKKSHLDPVIIDSTGPASR